MYRFQNLRIELNRQRVSLKDLALAIGMNYQALSNRMNGVTQFKLNEIYKIMFFLDLPVDLLPQYFPNYGVTRKW